MLLGSVSFLFLRHKHLLCLSTSSQLELLGGSVGERDCCVLTGFIDNTIGYCEHVRKIPPSSNCVQLTVVLPC